MIRSQIQKFTSGFLADENGAVTVDWVMLTAGIVLLGVLVVGGIQLALDDAASGISISIVSGTASALN